VLAFEPAAQGMLKSPPMQASEFVRKWSGAAGGLGERAGAQAHFIDLCRLLDVPEPGDPDRYCFERGLTKTGSAAGRTDGFADVWLKGCFAWEYKAPGKSLDGALRQLMMYALPLESPPLLVVSDRLQIEVHTHFTGTPSEKHVFALEDIVRPEVQQRLRTLWTQPDAWRPRRSNREITEEAARTFAATAERLRTAGAAPDQVSHFLTQCVFCFFSEDAGLLPERLFERLVGAKVDAAALRGHLQRLFETMRDGGLFGVDAVPWFNGGLFAQVNVPPLADADVLALKAASALDWSAIDPSIFGTLFERGLDPAKRSQLGAHYTDPATIMRLVEPVVQRPLLAEWAACKPAIEAALAKSRKHGDKAYRDAQATFVVFLERLKAYRVLDPACGSGNFLFLALKTLKDIEHQVNLEAEALGLERQHDVTGPHNVLGIELNEYAAELARVTVWIGELQWRLDKGYGFKTQPVLEPLDHIQCRDALLNADGSEAAWPSADAVVGNPPFVGDKKMRGELGDDYTEALREAYKGRVPGGGDLVCYWFEKARVQIEAGRLQRAGLVSSNVLPVGTQNLKVLARVAATAAIFDAWRDLPWVNDGAAVRVALTAFGHGVDATPTLNGQPVHAISSALHAVDVGEDRLVAQPNDLAENAGAALQGITKGGSFEVEGAVARRWLQRPNPNLRTNADVLRPWWKGEGVTQRDPDMWIIDFFGMSEVEAAGYELPFAHVLQAVKPKRDLNKEPSTRRNYWLFKRSGADMRVAVAGLPRLICAPETPTHTVFAWVPAGGTVDKNLVVIARSDDVTMGLLCAKPHLAWVQRFGAPYGNHPSARRYNNTRTFEPFPFPAGLTPADTAHQRTEATTDGALIPADLPASLRPYAEAIARAAQRLVALRDAWLNPPEWTERVPEVVPLGMAASPYPDRVIAKAGFETELAKRTLTNLYNQRPAWLAQAHAALDAAVAAAYGWADYTPAMPNDEILRRLLTLNLQRSAVGIATSRDDSQAHR
jgi:SAM-dependent methyltransferase